MVRIALLFAYFFFNSLNGIEIDARQCRRSKWEKSFRNNTSEKSIVYHAYDSRSVAIRNWKDEKWQ